MIVLPNSDNPFSCAANGHLWYRFENKRDPFGCEHKVGECCSSIMKADIKQTLEGKKVRCAWKFFCRLLRMRSCCCCCCSSLKYKYARQRHRRILVSYGYVHHARYRTPYKDIPGMYEGMIQEWTGTPQNDDGGVPTYGMVEQYAIICCCTIQYAFMEC